MIPAPKQHIYKVSELNSIIKLLLEDEFPFLWISGEISNFRIPASGHCYFTLKDAKSQIPSIIFRSQAAALSFVPKEGMAVIGFGRISVYEPRGTYQIILEYLEPKGVGNRQIAFEELKRKLTDEGLFSESHKQALPHLPTTIGIVTSPTGAAVHDFIKIARRRFSNLPLRIVPVRVQGQLASQEITRAIQLLNREAASDVIVLARGGGSIEDLWAFNEECVARAIHASRIPVVAAIGHETDFTISDFVADRRAPTPSAAAEMVIPSKLELETQVVKIKQQLYVNIKSILKYLEKNTLDLSERVVHPQRRIDDWRIRLDDLSIRANQTIRDILSRKEERLELRHQLLMNMSPSTRIGAYRDRIDTHRRSLQNGIGQHLRNRKATLANTVSTLEALNPMAILKRGYSITRTIPKQGIIRNARTVKQGQHLEVLLGRGKLSVTVDEKKLE